MDIILVRKYTIEYRVYILKDLIDFTLFKHNPGLHPSTYPFRVVLSHKIFDPLLEYILKKIKQNKKNYPKNILSILFPDVRVIYKLSFWNINAQYVDTRTNNVSFKHRGVNLSVLVFGSKNVADFRQSTKSTE